MIAALRVRVALLAALSMLAMGCGGSEAADSDPAGSDAAVADDSSTVEVDTSDAGGAVSDGDPAEVVPGDSISGDSVPADYDLGDLDDLEALAEATGVLLFSGTSADTTVTLDDGRSFVVDPSTCDVYQDRNEWNYSLSGGGASVIYRYVFSAAEPTGFHSITFNQGADVFIVTDVLASTHDGTAWDATVVVQDGVAVEGSAPSIEATISSTCVE